MGEQGRIFQVGDLLGNVDKFQYAYSKTSDGNAQIKVSVDGEPVRIRFGSYKEPLFSFFGAGLNAKLRQKMERDGKIDEKRTISFGLPRDKMYGQQLQQFLEELDNYIFNFIGKLSDYWQPFYDEQIEKEDMDGNSYPESQIQLQKDMIRKTQFNRLVRKFKPPKDPHKLSEFNKNYGEGKVFDDNGSFKIVIKDSPFKVNVYSVKKMHENEQGNETYEAYETSWQDLEYGKFRFFADVTIRQVYFFAGRYGISLQGDNIYVIPSNLGMNSNRGPAPDVKIVPRPIHVDTPPQQQQGDVGMDEDYSLDNDAVQTQTGHASPANNDQGPSFIPPQQYNGSY